MTEGPTSPQLAISFDYGVYNPAEGGGKDVFPGKLFLYGSGRLITANNGFPRSYLHNEFDASRRCSGLFYYRQPGNCI